MKKIQLPVLVEKIQTLADGSIKIAFVTQELKAEAAALLFDLRSRQGWLLFAEQEVTENDLEVPEVSTEFPQDKTPSQRLRNVLYKFWEVSGRDKTFEEFYKIHMEKLIRWVKEKLN